MSIPGHLTRWLPLILYCGLIYYLSSGPPPGFTETDLPGSDKVLHMGAFAVWGFLCGWALAGSAPRLAGGWFVLVVTAAGLLYGLSDELHQSFVEGRTADRWDLVADLVGSLIGGCAALAYLRVRRGYRETAGRGSGEV